MQTLHFPICSLNFSLKIYYALDIVLSFISNAVNKTNYVPACIEITFLWEDKEGHMDRWTDEQMDRWEAGIKGSKGRRKGERKKKNMRLC